MASRGSRGGIEQVKPNPNPLFNFTGFPGFHPSSPKTASRESQSHPSQSPLLQPQSHSPPQAKPDRHGLQGAQPAFLSTWYQSDILIPHISAGRSGMARSYRVIQRK
ncbi:hypothetical protein LY78DRAFT_653986 [Colletotrichum sublineola]|nr:hypothetical protein LY78DRAFT_653986 [Colletotrichum sublineola]